MTSCNGVNHKTKGRVRSHAVHSSSRKIPTATLHFFPRNRIHVNIKQTFPYQSRVRTLVRLAMALLSRLISCSISCTASACVCTCCRKQSSLSSQCTAGCKIATTIAIGVTAAPVQQKAAHPIPLHAITSNNLVPSAPVNMIQDKANVPSASQCVQRCNLSRRAHAHLPPACRWR